MFSAQSFFDAHLQTSSPFAYLHHAVMDGRVLFLLQHHQGDNNHCCYDDATHHESNDCTFVWTHIFCKEYLKNKQRKRFAVDQMCEKYEFRAPKSQQVTSLFNAYFKI